MSPPFRQRFNRDFEVDLGAELGLDNPYPGHGSRAGKVVLITVGLCVCLVFGIAVGYVTSGREPARPTVEVPPPTSEGGEQAVPATPATTEAALTVQRRLSAVALEEAGQVILAATRRGADVASPPSPSVDEARPPASESRRRRTEPRPLGPGPLVPFAEEPPPSLEERLAPLLEIEQTDPYTREQ